MSTGDQHNGPKFPPMPSQLTEYDRGRFDAFNEAFATRPAPDPGYPVTVVSVPGSAWDVLAQDRDEWKERAGKADDRAHRAEELVDARTNEREAALARVAYLESRERLLESHARCAAVYVRKLDGGIVALLEEIQRTDQSLHARAIGMLKDRFVRVSTDRKPSRASAGRRDEPTAQSGAPEVKAEHASKDDVGVGGEVVDEAHAPSIVSDAQTRKVNRPRPSDPQPETLADHPWGPGCAHDPDCASELEHRLAVEASQRPKEPLASPTLAYGWDAQTGGGRHPLGIGDRVRPHDGEELGTIVAIPGVHVRWDGDPPGQVVDLPINRLRAAPCGDGYLCEHGYCSHTQAQRPNEAKVDEPRELPKGWDVVSKDSRTAYCLEGPWCNTYREALATFPRSETPNHAPVEQDDWDDAIHGWALRMRDVFGLRDTMDRLFGKGGWTAMSPVHMAISTALHRLSRAEFDYLIVKNEKGIGVPRWRHKGGPL